MNKRKLWALIAAPGLAVVGLLLAFLLLGRITIVADAASDEVDNDSYRLPLLNADMGVCSGVWVTETVDSAGDVGEYTSLALAPTHPYTPHISYHDVASDTLKYTYLSGTTWVSETVDSGGRWTSLALVPDYPYTPCISYHDFWGWALRYACRDGITWTIRHLESRRAGLLGTSLALEPNYPYTPHISYYLPFNINDLIHVHLSSTVWMSGTWMYTTVDSDGSVGTYNSLALDHAGYPHISYRQVLTSGGPSRLKHAWLSGTTWLSETVDSAGNVGGYTSLALDPSDNPHISYYDYTNLDLKYAWLDGTAWTIETVDSAGNVGEYTSLALDPSGNPHISYYDYTNRDLKYAWLSGTTWFSETVDSREEVGQYTSLALDRVGCPHISYYDVTNDDLKYAYVPAVVYYLPVIFKNY